MNINNLSNPELVCFLQKIGQHDAARIVKKHDIDGKILTLPLEQHVDQLTQIEQFVLLRCINLLKTNPNFIVSANLAALEKDNDPLEDASVKKPEYEFFNKKFTSVTVTSREKKNRLFAKHRDTVESQISTASSSTYICSPESINVDRFDEILVNRIKKYARPEDITEQKKEHHYETLTRLQVIQEDSEDTKTKKKDWFSCIFKLCCFHCNVGCMKKSK